MENKKPRETMSSTIKQIINNHQTETYPRGVGSVFRCIESGSFEQLEKAIKERIFTVITEDLHDELKASTHTHKDVKEWIDKIM